MMTSVWLYAQCSIQFSNRDFRSVFQRVSRNVCKNESQRHRNLFRPGTTDQPKNSSSEKEKGPLRTIWQLLCVVIRRKPRTLSLQYEMRTDIFTRTLTNDHINRRIHDLLGLTNKRVNHKGK